MFSITRRRSFLGDKSGRRRRVRWTKHDSSKYFWTERVDEMLTHDLVGGF